MAQLVSSLIILGKGRKFEILSDLWRTIQKDSDSLVHAIGSIMSRAKRFEKLESLVSDRIKAHSPHANELSSETIENEALAIWHRMKNGESRESALQTLAIKYHLPEDRELIVDQLRELARDVFKSNKAFLNVFTCKGTLEADYDTLMQKHPGFPAAIYNAADGLTKGTKSYSIPRALKNSRILGKLRDRLNETDYFDRLNARTLASEPPVDVIEKSSPPSIASPEEQKESTQTDSTLKESPKKAASDAPRVGSPAPPLPPTPKESLIMDQLREIAREELGGEVRKQFPRYDVWMRTISVYAANMNKAFDERARRYWDSLQAGILDAARLGKLRDRLNKAGYSKFLE